MDIHSDSNSAFRRGLAGYLRAIAAAVGVSKEGTTFEISDTATAYLALDGRWSGRPGQDLMLVWSERHGWVVAVETDPAEAPVVLAYFGGDDPVPEPRVVARFVTDVVAGVAAGGHDDRPPRPAFSIVNNRQLLAERLARYDVDPS
ncbi:MAG: hypothetical protein GEU98_16110 [Pseudonocardiaceae bacterium]|nr:hypothetical protein [Pseudonocardiaceae bacterium]